MSSWRLSCTIMRASRAAEACPNYSDAKNVSSWAKNAVKWANGKGLLGYISLEGAKSYGPRKAALRSETAYNMYKYLG